MYEYELIRGSELQNSTDPKHQTVKEQVTRRKYWYLLQHSETRPTKIIHAFSTKVEGQEYKEKL